jgi:hypothetical protein
MYVYYDYHFRRLKIQPVDMIIWTARMQAGNTNRAYNKEPSLHVILEFLLSIFMHY